MGLFTGLIQQMITDLQSELPEIKFSMSYSNTKKANPITEPTAVLNFEGIEVNEGAMGDFIRTNSTGELSGKKAKLKVGLKLYSPHKDGGESCLLAFDDICNSLVFGNMTLKPNSIQSNQVTYNSTAFAFILDSELSFDFIVGKETTMTAISDIVVKGVY